MRNILPALVLLLSPLAARAESGAMPAFGFTGVAALRAGTPALAAPAASASDVIVQGHMLIQAGTSVLFGYADTQEQFAQAVAYWSAALRAANVEPGAAVLKDGMFTLPYRTTDGRVLRSFLADARQFPPKDDNGLRANMALAGKALSSAGLTPVSSLVVNLDTLLPTYSILYLVKPEAQRERETQLRVLKPGGDIDAGLIKKSGVTVVQTPESWLLVYVGPALGVVGLWAKTPEELAQKLEKRKAYLTGLGARIVGEKLEPIDDAEYKFGAQLMFFQ